MGKGAQMGVPVPVGSRSVSSVSFACWSERTGGVFRCFERTKWNTNKDFFLDKEAKAELAGRDEVILFIFPG